MNREYHYDNATNNSNVLNKSKTKESVCLSLAVANHLNSAIVISNHGSLKLSPSCSSKRNWTSHVKQKLSALQQSQTNNNINNKMIVEKGNKTPASSSSSLSSRLQQDDNHDNVNLIQERQHHSCHNPYQRITMIMQNDGTSPCMIPTRTMTTPPPPPPPPHDINNHHHTLDNKKNNNDDIENQRRRCKHSKKVMINTLLNKEIPSSLTLTEEDIRNGWWTRQEKHNRCNEIQNQACRLARARYDIAILIELIDICSVHPKEMLHPCNANKHATFALDAVETLRGLENYLAPILGDRVPIYVSNVLTFNDAIPKQIDSDKRATLLAKRCVFLSRPSAAFAREIGKLDEILASGGGEEEEEEEEV